MKIAIINNFFHEYTTAVYFEEAFKEAGHETVRISPKKQKSISEDFDFLCYIDDATEYVLYPNPNYKKILYIIDTHLGIDEDINMIKYADFVFCAQHDALKTIKKFNPNCDWLPLGCAEKYHGKINVNKKYDIAFIGSRGTGRRAEVYDFVKDNYPNSFLGMAKREEIGKIYSSSKIVLNVAINNDINMRFFEAMCSGSMLLTDTIVGNGYEQIKNNGQNCFAEYSHLKDLDHQIKYYLKNEDEREEIALRGKTFSKNYEYSKKCELMIKTANNLNINKQSKINYFFDSFKLINKKIINKLRTQIGS